MSSSRPILLLSSLLLLSTAATAINILSILSKNPEFSSFSQYLNETGLAKEINKRATITVLALSNSAVGSISGKSSDVMKRILETHVVLDYYDVPKLQKMKDKTALLTTMYQSSGVANGRQGFLNVTNEGKGEIIFGSAVKDAPHESKLLKLVASQPFNVSVLEISSAIIAPGIDGNFTTPPMAPGPAPGPSPVKAKSPKKAPAPKKGKGSGSDSDSDSSADAPEAETPAETPTDAPTPSPEPSADSAPPKSDTDGPAKDDAAAPAPASSAPRAVLSVGGMMGFVSALLVAF